MTNDEMTNRGEVFGRRPTWAEVDLDALAANFQTVQRRVGPNVTVMAVVKADAYGHGAVECAQRLAREGAKWFAVAIPEEALELRRAGIEQPILCLGGFWDGQEEACVAGELVPVVYRIDMIEALDRAARQAHRITDVHLKIDTGMGRLGVCCDAVREFIDALDRFKNIRIDGLMTHFAAADDPRLDGFTTEQLERFKETVNTFRARGYNPTYQHLANSAATFAHPEAFGNMARPGGVLYGLWRDTLAPAKQSPGLRPVMAVRSRIMLLKRVRPGEALGYGCTFEASRETLVATVPIGYNDGYVRALSNRGRVIVRGHFAPVVGRVSMDLTLLDVTDVPSVALADRVTLLGEDGALHVTAEEIAQTTGTLSYEITCGISKKRVPRYYLSSAQG